MHDPRPLDVDAHELGLAVRAGASCRRRGTTRSTPAQRPPQRRAIAELRRRRPRRRGPSSASRDELARTRHPHVVAARDAAPARRATRRTRRAGDERLAHAAIIAPRRAPQVGPLGCPAPWAGRRRRHRLDALHAARGHRARTASTSSRSTSAGATRRATTARPTCRTSTTSTTHLRTARELPTTSQPSVGDFLAVYEPLIEAGRRHRLDPPLRRHLGHRPLRRAGARPAVERGVAPERIVIVDSADGVRGLGLMALAAAQRRRRRRRRRRRGRGARARCATDLKILFAVDTLEFLRRGGRIGGAQAWIGSTLQDQADPGDRVTRSSRRARAHVGPRVRAHGRPPRSAARGRQRPLLRPAHPGRRPGGEARRSAARRSTAAPPEFVSEMGPVIGAHAGPGLIGVTALRDAAARPGLSAARSRRAGPRTQRPRWRAGVRSPAPRRLGPRRTRVVLRIVLIVVLRRPRALPDLPAAQAADVDLHRRLPRDRAVGPGQLPAAADARAGSRSRSSTSG